MVREAVRITAALLAVLIATALTPPTSSLAQRPDTVCVPTDQLSQARQEIQRLRHRDSTSTALVYNLRAQVGNLSAQAAQDSIIADALEQRLDIRDDHIEWQERRIEHLSGALRTANRRRWLYFAGGAAAVALGGYAAGQAAP